MRTKHKLWQKIRDVKRTYVARHVRFNVENHPSKHLKNQKLMDLKVEGRQIPDFVDGGWNSDCGYSWGMSRRLFPKIICLDWFFESPPIRTYGPCTINIVDRKKNRATKEKLRIRKKFGTWDRANFFCLLGPTWDHVLRPDQAEGPSTAKP